MPRALLPWLAPTPQQSSAQSVTQPAPVQEPARVDRWVAPTPEVVVARKTNVRPAHAARTSRKPRGGDRHAAEAPTQPVLKSEPPAPTPTPIESEGPSRDIDDHGRFGHGADESPSAATYSAEEIEAAVDELLDPVAVVAAVAKVVEPTPIDVIALLAKNDGERADLRADQALPPRFVVLGPKGSVLARFHGCEHATHCNHTIGGRGVIRLEDGKPMTGREP